MRRRSQGYGFWLLTVLGFALTAQALVYLTTIDLTIGVSPLFGRQQDAPATSHVDLRVAVLRSDLSSRIEGQDPRAYFELSRAWMDLLAAAGIEYGIVNDEDLTEGLDLSYDVLVLPSAVCLSQVQRNVIAGTLRAGMGVVAGGPIGARNENCEWIGMDYTAEFSGLRDPEAVATDAADHALFRGSRFYSGLVPTGYNLPLPPQEIIVGSAVGADVYWGDRRTRPGQGRESTDAALAVHGVRGKGRFVWYGFSESVGGRKAEDHRALDGYLQSAVLWTGRQPVAALEDWPDHSQGAVVLANNVQDDTIGVGPSVSLLKENNAPATFFLTPASAAANAGSLVEAADLIEAAVTDLDAEPFTGSPLRAQGDRLTQLKAAVERALKGRMTFGFRPPQELADTSTVAALEAQDFDYYYDGGASLALTPTTVLHEPEGWLEPMVANLTRLSSPGLDDFEALATYGGSTEEVDAFVTFMLEDFERTIDAGGAYTLAFRNDLLGAPENLTLLERVIHGVQRAGVWMTTAGDLARWRSTRSQVSVDSRYVSSSRIRLAVTNRGLEPLNDAVVNVRLPYALESVRVIPAVLRTGLPETSLIEDQSILSLGFPSIKAQSSYVLLIAMDEGN